MAAPQWGGGKCKSIQQAKAYFRHNTNDRRMEVQHTNPHINTRLTHLNFSVKGLNYQERCEAYDKRMGEIDQGKPGSGKNARTLMISVVVYPPIGLLGDKPRLREWFIRAGQVAEARFGSNMIDMAVDFDEIHDYRDKTGQVVTSREHGHLWLVPEVDGKLNGKQFSSRAVITGFNAELQAMSIQEFGCPMMDGSKAKGGRPVEDLKAESRAAEIIANAEEAAESRLRAAEAAAGKIMADAQETAQKASEEARRLAQEIVANAKRDAESLEWHATYQGENMEMVSRRNLKVQKRVKETEKLISEVTELLDSVKPFVQQMTNKDAGKYWEMKDKQRELADKLDTVNADLEEDRREDERGQEKDTAWKKAVPERDAGLLKRLEQLGVNIKLPDPLDAADKIDAHELNW